MVSVEVSDLEEERAAIRRWLTQYGAMHAARDEQIRKASAFGLTATEIGQLLSLSPKHVSVIITQR